MSQVVNELVPLGRTNIRISPFGVGTWAWGDRFFWGYGKGHGEQDVREAFQVSLDAGINFYDTAEIYGSGRSEVILGRLVREANRPLVVATKFLPLPWRWRRSAIVERLRASLKRLGLPRVGLYQIHWAVPFMPIETLMQGLADAVEAGLTEAVGVSNFDVNRTRRAYDALARRGIPLASNQVRYSLLHRSPERDGLAAFCREHNITLIAYSPIGQGVLTGKYTPEAPPPGVRGRRYHSKYIERAQPLIQLLGEIGQAHARSAVQVALNWVICKGAVPIPGAKTGAQARENAGALGWQLTAEEVAQLDRASDQI